MKFRKDINGLRAIAVLAVVLFHFEPSIVRGGFIGVDIFFVISGFLMTSIVMTKLEANKFSVISFYVSRANRIIPALLVLVGTLIIFLPFIIPIPDFIDFTKRAISAVLFVSNNYFYSQGGYFETDSKFNWLLHTWSLSVEWQFYLFFPLFAIAVYKFVPRNKLFLVVLLAFIFSFSLGVLFSYTKASLGYYMLVTRAWELLAGSLVYFIGVQLSTRRPKVLEYVGLGLILIAIIIVDESTPWPGYMAILPVSGTCLVLLSHRYTSRITGNFVFQSVGLWSYSIYLWHWPIVVLGEFIGFTYWTLCGLAASLLFGWLSYSLIETRNPFSFSLFNLSKSWTAPIVVAVACVCTLISLEIATISGKAFPEKVEPFTIGISYEENGKKKYPVRGTLVHINKSDDNNPEYLLIGDSNAAHFAFGISSEDTRHYILSWVSSCLNFPDYTTKPYAGWMNEEWRNLCKNNYKRIYDHNEIDVILAQHWYKKNGVVCVSDTCDLDLDSEPYSEVLENQLEKLVSIIGTSRKFYIIGYVPAPTDSVVLCMKKLDNSHCKRETDLISRERIEINESLEIFAKKYTNVKFINPFVPVCNAQDKCKTIIDDKNIFFDDGHLSQYGSKIMWNYIATQLE